MEIRTLADLLHEKQCSCVVGNKGIRTFSRPGIVDIYELLYGDWHFLCGATVADKVVGKAAATLMVLGGVKRVHADVISCPAHCLLKRYKVEVEFGQMVGLIWNRDHSGVCELEKLCSKEDDLMEILKIIDKFISGKAS